MGSVILDHTPAEVIRTALVQLELGSYGIAYRDWPVFSEMEPDKPDNLITVYDIDGIKNAREMPTGEVQEHYGVRIRVRAARDLVNGIEISGARVCRNKVNDVMRALDQSIWNYPIAVLNDIGSGTTDYTLHSANRNGTVVRLGRMRNNSERYIYTVDYLVALTQD
jgi:hypothetical protein